MPVYSLLSTSIAAACLLGLARGVSIEVRADGQLSTQEPHQHLVICNAFAHESSMSVKNLRTHWTLTQDKPLAYKQCGLYKPTLHEGDRLEFFVGNTTIGIFRTNTIPENLDTLMLVPHRRFSSAMGGSFDSHAFLLASSPQIATVDAFRNRQDCKVNIMDLEDKDLNETEQRSEALHFDSVVSLSPGDYHITLEKRDGTDIANSSLHVREGNGGIYVVIRAGVTFEPKDENDTNPFPQELFIFDGTFSGATGVSLLFAAAISFMHLARWV